VVTQFEPDFWRIPDFFSFGFFSLPLYKISLGFLGIDDFLVVFLSSSVASLIMIPR